MYILHEVLILKTENMRKLKKITLHNSEILSSEQMKDIVGASKTTSTGYFYFLECFAGQAQLYPVEDCSLATKMQTCGHTDSVRCVIVEYIN